MRSWRQKVLVILKNATTPTTTNGAAWQLCLVRAATPRAEDPKDTRGGQRHEEGGRGRASCFGMLTRISAALEDLLPDLTDKKHTRQMGRAGVREAPGTQGHTCQNAAGCFNLRATVCSRRPRTRARRELRSTPTTAACACRVRTCASARWRGRHSPAWSACSGRQTTCTSTPAAGHHKGDEAGPGAPPGAASDSDRMRGGRRASPI